MELILKNVNIACSKVRPIDLVTYLRKQKNNDVYKLAIYTPYHIRDCSR